MFTEPKIVILIILLFSVAMITEPTTVYASEEENEQDDTQYVDELCDASEDYEANKEECDKLYDALEEDAKDDINSFEDGIISKETNKKACEEDAGTWVDGECDFKTDDEDKADEFLDDVQKIEEFEEEKADLEDALCDDPEDSEKFDVCNP